MENDVHRYLAEYQAHYETVESWPIQGKLRVRLNLAKTLPPAGVSSSILSIVLNRDREVLFLYPTEVTGSIAHLLIGGRLKRVNRRKTRLSARWPKKRGGSLNRPE
jgi:hypothetical protein